MIVNVCPTDPSTSSRIFSSLIFWSHPSLGKSGLNLNVNMAEDSEAACLRSVSCMFHEYNAMATYNSRDQISMV